MHRIALAWLAMIVLLVTHLAATSGVASDVSDKGDSAGRVREVIRKIHRESSEEMRYDLAYQLSEFSWQVDPAEFDATMIDDIASLLSDRNDGVRGWAAAALGHIGPRASAAIPALEKALREPIYKYSKGSVMKPSLDSTAAIKLALRKIRGEQETGLE